jgi:hypothetical protein
MATNRAEDLHAFKSFVDQQLSGEPVPTVHEVIDRWHCETQSDEERAATAQAATESLDDTEKVVADLRKKFGLTCDARALQRNPAEWVKRLQELVASQPIRPNNMDDSRESIYAGRGE